MNVSIVIPARDAAATVAETLDSVLAQTFTGWEVIVVDDGSVDETARIVGAYAARDPRIRLISQETGGEAAARNTGIDAARHEWLLFLDADDWIAPSYLTRQTAALAADPDLDAVHCGSVRVALDGTHVSDGYAPPAGDLFPTLANRAAFPVHACVVRTRLVRDVGGFDTSFEKSTDWDLWQRVARAGARFGAVREVLAYYRMQPQSASLGADRLLTDGLRVLRQGHAPDPRVPRANPIHAAGAPPEEVRSQQFYLLCWCAGLMIGQRLDPRGLFTRLDASAESELYPDAVARCLFESATLPICRTPEAWEALWSELREPVETFLSALAARSPTPDLEGRTILELKRLVLRHAPTWRAVVEDLERQDADLRRRLETAEREAAAARDAADQARRAAARITALEQQLVEWTEQHGEWRRRTDAQEARAAELAARLATAEAASEEWHRQAVDTESRLQALRHQHDALREDLGRSRAESASRRAEIDDLLAQPLVRLSLRLRSAWRRTEPARDAAVFAFQRARLAVDRRVGQTLAPTRQRVLATACWHFPIYSQTFVYQELTQLLGSGREVRFLYGALNRRDPLPAQFAPLWRSRRRAVMSPAVCRASYEHFVRAAPARVEALIDQLASASGLGADVVRQDYHVGQAFAFARMVQAYRPDYLHSYFFYEGTLFTFVASYLLDIPRGVSCYADHLLRDYPLKVVPLHLRHCAIVVATSNRIRDELLALAPGMDPARIVVKPNGINADSFPAVARVDPPAGESFTLVTVCRIEPKKGLTDLVEAIALLRERGVRVRLHVLGGVDDSDSSRACDRELRARIAALGLGDDVRLEGRQTESAINRFFSSAQIFVAPFVETEGGDKDGIPTSLLEGMSAGLPVVATDAGSMTEVVEDGVQGLVVPQRDPVALAAAVQTLLADADRRRRMGEAAARRVRETFDARVCERVLQARLDGVLAFRSPRASAAG